MGNARFRRINLRLLAIIAILAIMATAAYGFAASNTVQSSRAGDGFGAVSGYKVSNIQYTMDTANPANIASVRFTLNQSAGSAQVRFGDSAGNFGTGFPCGVTGGGSTPATDWTCAITSSVSVASVYNLDVAAAD